ncbi:hypothetical protein ACFO4L_00425 [Bacillus daqingensis]|uniref:Antirepressor AbbA n=1 Tax=Bacillus daqingensis TaxID=872396 RepID=A0ABV9NSV5_9BACI
MNVDKQDILRLLDGLSEDDMRIIYTFIEEYQIAEMQQRAQRYSTKRESHPL